MVRSEVVGDTDGDVVGSAVVGEVEGDMGHPNSSLCSLLRVHNSGINIDA